MENTVVLFRRYIELSTEGMKFIHCTFFKNAECVIVSNRAYLQMYGYFANCCSYHDSLCNTYERYHFSLFSFSFFVFCFPENAGKWNLDLFQGDIKLNSHQRLALKLGLDFDGRMSGSRGATAYRSLLWRNGVLPYTIEKNLGKKAFEPMLGHAPFAFHFLDQFIFPSILWRTK